MKAGKPVILIILAALILAACAPAETQPPVGSPTDMSPTPADGEQLPPKAALEASKWLSAQLGVAQDEIVLDDVERVDWSDSCLGLGGPAESCLAAITPGFKLTFRYGETTYVVRTDMEGQQFRAENLDLPKGGPVVLPGPEAVQEAARQALADQLGLDLGSITVTSVEAVEWPNSCLGVERPEEACLAVITPGFRVLLEAGGQTYQVNANQDGSHVRVVEPSDQGAAEGESLPAVQAARTYLAQQLGIAEDAVSLVKAEAVDWPDSCLGVDMPGRMCAQMITPGYIVILEADGRQYEFHTDQAGGAVAAALAPLPEDAELVVTWQQTEGQACREAVIGAQSVKVGACGETLEEVNLPEERLVELAYLYGSFASFEAETPAGKVTLEGQGQREPSDAEMRSVAEWAKLVAAEAVPTRGEQDDGLVLTYHREGGFAGFCSDAAVYRTGWVMTSSCKPGQEGAGEPYRLNGDELEQLYAWVDSLESFEYVQKDSATADSMTVRLIFNGEGTQEATAAQQEEIAQFAGNAFGASVR